MQNAAPCEALNSPVSYRRCLPWPEYGRRAQVTADALPMVMANETELVLLLQNLIGNWA